MSSRVTFPERRRNLATAARCLGDTAFQTRYWQDRHTPLHDLPTFEEAVAAVRDDLTGAPEALLGDVLLDERELTRFTGLLARLDAVVTRIGPFGGFREAVGTPEWRAMQTAAVRLIGALSVGDVRAGALDLTPALVPAG